MMRLKISRTASYEPEVYAMRRSQLVMKTKLKATTNMVYQLFTVPYSGS